MAFAADMMPSASKQRRLRAAATRQKLYEASSHSHSLNILGSQIAMLTSSVDSLLQFFSYSYNCVYSPSQCQHASPSTQAAEFFPPDFQCKTGASQLEIEVCLKRCDAATDKLLEYYFSSCDAQACTALQGSWSPLPEQSLGIFTDSFALGDGGSLQALTHLPTQFPVGAGSTGPTSERKVTLKPRALFLDSDHEHSIAIMKVLARASVSKVDFYPKDHILVVKTEGQDPDEFFVGEGVLAKVSEITRKSDLKKRFQSHFNISLLSSAEDDWEFLRKNLEPCLVQMRPQFREACLNRSDSNASANQLAERLLAEAMSGVLGSVQSVSAKKVMNRYQTRIQLLLRRCIEDVFAQVGSTEGVETAQKSKDVTKSGISAGSFPSVMQAKPKK